MGVNYNPKTVTDGLVLALDAANSKSYPGSGTTWTDLSGNANNGTLVNGVQYSNDSLGSFSFDGIDDQISCGLSGGSLNTEYTYIIWFKFDQGTRTAGSGRKDIIYGIDYPRPHFSFDREGDGKWGNYITKGGSDNNTVKSTTNTWNNNRWYMISTTGSSSRDRIYVDESLENEVAISGTYNSWSTFNFSLSNSQAFPGKISSAYFYNKELTLQEIKQNFNATRSRYGI